MRTRHQQSVGLESGMTLAAPAEHDFGICVCDYMGAISVVVEQAVAVLGKYDLADLLEATEQAMDEAYVHERGALKARGESLRSR